MIERRTHRGWRFLKHFLGLDAVDRRKENAVIIKIIVADPKNSKNVAVDLVNRKLINMGTAHATQKDVIDAVKPHLEQFLANPAEFLKEE